MSAVSNRKFLYFKLYINNLSKCVKINPEGVKSATISNGYPEGRYFDISVEQLNGESTALFSVTKDTVDVVTYENNIWTNRYSLATKSDLSPIGTVFWSGFEEIQCVKDTWVSGQMTITLPAGTYVIFGHAVLDAGTSTGVLQINNAKAVEAYQTYYSSVYRRQVTVSCFFNFTEQVTLSVGLFDSANTKATTCEVCAVRIK